MKENTFYFTHDFNAQNDEKVESMIFRLGWESYGLFWALIEKLAQDPNHRLKKEYDRISNVLRTTENLIKRIVEDFGLFVVDLEFFYSERLIRHFEKREEKSQKAKDSIRKRWDKNTNVIRTYYECNTIKERKEKEIKEKEIKEKEILNTSVVASSEKTDKQIKSDLKLKKDIEKLKELEKHDYFKNEEFLELWEEYSKKKSVNAKNLNLKDLFSHSLEECISALKKTISSGWKGIGWPKHNQATNGKMSHDEALRIAGERIKEEERLASLKPASLENHSITEELINDF